MIQALYTITLTIKMLITRSHVTNANTQSTEWSPAAVQYSSLHRWQKRRVTTVHHSCNLHIYQPRLCPSMNYAALLHYDKGTDAVMDHCTYCHNVHPSTARMNLTKTKMLILLTAIFLLTVIASYSYKHSWLALCMYSFHWTLLLQQSTTCICKSGLADKHLSKWACYLTALPLWTQQHSMYVINFDSCSGVNSANCPCCITWVWGLGYRGE